MKKKSIVIAAVILVIIVIPIVIASLALSGGNYKLSRGSSLAALDKIKDAQLKGAAVELSKEEINGLTKVYFKDGRTKGSITIKGLDVDFQDNNMLLHIPITYKGINLLVSSKGELSYIDDKIIFKPISYSVGKLPLPKSIVVKVLGRYSGGDITLADNSIEVNKNMLPFSFKDIKIVNNKLSIDFERLSIGDLFGGVGKGQESSVKNTGGNKADNTKSSGNQSTNGGTAKNTSGGGSTDNSKNSGQVSSGSKGSDKTKQSLSKVSSQLGSAAAAAKTSNGKRVISMMQATVNAVAGNPNYNYRSNAGAVLSLYKTLSPEERNDVKSSIFSHVDINTAAQLRGTFGI